MNHRTLKVLIDHGKVTVLDPSQLPDTGSGILTIDPLESTAANCLTPLQALDALQKQLRLNQTQAGEWMDQVRAGRR